MNAAVIASAAGAGLLGGVFPWINGELVVAASTAVLPRHAVPVLVVAVSAAQLLAKAGLYALARWAPTRLPRRALALLERSRGAMEGRATVLILVASSAVSLPPFYLTTLAAGAVRVPLAVFLGAGATGVLARNAAVAWLAFTVAPSLVTGP